jgi:hypothetical protein
MKEMLASMRFLMDERSSARLMARMRNSLSSSSVREPLAAFAAASAKGRGREIGREGRKKEL